MDLLERIQKVTSNSARLTKYHVDLLTTGPFAGQFQTHGYFIINEKNVSSGPLVLSLSVQGFCENNHPLTLAHVPLLFTEFSLQIRPDINSGAFAYVSFSKEAAGWAPKENFLGYSRTGVSYGLPLKPTLEDWAHFQPKQQVHFNDIGLPHLPKMKLGFNSPSEAVSALHLLYAYTK
ncbi:MAG TPA: hypothetical protein VK158_04970 [Acidobacteriota bacterium]|nr:hypothetical protein [Acidobacteriota bacterium]